MIFSSLDLRSALAEVLALALPIECAGCGVDDRALCDSCVARLAPRVSERQIGEGLRVWSGLTYDGVPRSVMLALKEQQRTGVARQLGHALRAAVDAAAAVWPLDEPVALVTVPGSRAAYRRRGYDPVKLLLTHAGLDALRWFAPARPHTAQKSLGLDDRGANLSGAFRLRRAVGGIRVLLIDDVVTTGSTLVEAARVLRAAGADVLGAATVASTPLRRSSSEAYREPYRASPRDLSRPAQLPIRDITGGED